MRNYSLSEKISLNYAINKIKNCCNQRGENVFSLAVSLTHTHTFVFLLEYVGHDEKNEGEVEGEEQLIFATSKLKLGKTSFTYIVPTRLHILKNLVSRREWRVVREFCALSKKECPWMCKSDVYVCVCVCVYGCVRHTIMCVLFTCVCTYPRNTYTYIHT